MLDKEIKDDVLMVIDSLTCAVGGDGGYLRSVAFDGRGGITLWIA